MPSLFPDKSILNDYCNHHNTYVYQTLPKKDRDLEVFTGLYVFRWYLNRTCCIKCAAEYQRQDPTLMERIGNLAADEVEKQGKTVDNFRRSICYNENLRLPRSLRRKSRDK